MQAAERLANDKSTNKSVRRKRRKDLQAAALKLRGLEKGLYQLRLSASKPDIASSDFPHYNSQFSRSRAGSGFSLNSLSEFFNISIVFKIYINLVTENWPNFMGGGKTPKSCPTTPRGSVPDLTADNISVNSLSRFVFYTPVNLGHAYHF